MYQKSDQTYQSLLCSKNIFPYLKNVYHNVSSAWPLIRGLVAQKNIPWNLKKDSKDGTRACVALAIKSYFVLNNSIPDDECKLMENVFYNQDFVVLFWDYIETHSAEIFFSQKIDLTYKTIFLCMNNITFSMRENTNQNLILFEKFIDHLTRLGCGLVVFSQQELLTKNTSKAEFGFSMDGLKQNLKNTHHVSLEDAFLPNILACNTNKNTEDMFAVGAFDRLFELLAAGQDFLFSVENAINI